MKKLAARLLTVVIALAVSLFVAEMVVRLLFPAPQIVRVTHTTPAGAMAGTEKKELAISEHPDEGGVYTGTPTGKRLRPNRRITIENHRLSHQKVLIETNSLGYRNGEINEKTGTRILFLGDSVTFQDYLNEEQT